MEKEKDISSILLDELLEEIKEKEISSILLDEFLDELLEEIKKRRKKILSIMLDELLKKVEETKDFLLDEFNEVEKEEEEEIMQYILALSYIEDVINYVK
jgi:hypothetical protein